MKVFVTATTHCECVWILPALPSSLGTQSKQSLDVCTVDWSNTRLVHRLE